VAFQGSPSVPNVQVKLAHREQNKYINSNIASTSYTLDTALIVTQYHPGHAKSPAFLQQGYLTPCASFSCQRKRITLCLYPPTERVPKKSMPGEKKEI
jgi:hypothetical protein